MLPFTREPDKVAEGFARKIAQAKAVFGEQAFRSCTVGIVDDYSAMTIRRRLTIALSIASESASVNLLGVRGFTDTSIELGSMANSLV